MKSALAIVGICVVGVFATPAQAVVVSPPVAPSVAASVAATSAANAAVIAAAASASNSNSEDDVPLWAGILILGVPCLIFAGVVFWGLR